MDIKVSVVVAIYNSERYLAKTLDSIIEQSLNEIEILCVDDGSTDSSISILRDYEKKDDRIKILFQEKESQGAALARNMGIDVAVGKYISILDSDDFFEKDMLKNAYEMAEEKSSDIVIFDGFEYDTNAGADKEVGLILHREYLPENEECFCPVENADNLFMMTIGAAWNCLFRTDFIREKGIKFEDFHHADDLGFVFVAFASAKKISVIKERLIHYRTNNSQSQARNITKWPEASCFALDRLKTELENRNLYNTYRVSFIQKALQYIKFYLDNVDNVKAFEIIYNLLKSEYFDKLELDLASSEKIVEKKLADFRDFIKNHSAEEYLYYKSNRMSFFSPLSNIENRLHAGCKVVIYGAGKVGKEIVSQIEEEKNYVVTGWLDRAYEKLGYPVVNPETIKDTLYDFVIIAIESEDISKTVKEYMLDRGVESDRIIWIGEDYE